MGTMSTASAISQRTKLGLVTIEKLPHWSHPGTTVVCRPYKVFRDGKGIGCVTRIGARGKWSIDGRYGAWKTRCEAIQELQQRPQA